MREARCVLVGLLLWALLPTVGVAQTFDFTRIWQRCTLGLFTACAEISLRTAAVASGGTQVSVGIKNLQGNSQFDNSSGSLIHRLFFIFPPNTSGLQGAGSTRNVSATATGSAIAPRYDWTLTESGGRNAVADRFDLHGGLLPDGRQGGISGQNTTVNTQFVAADGATPNVSSGVWFSFFSPFLWDPRMNLRAGFIATNADGRVTCNHEAVDCVTHSVVTLDNFAETATVTPEPATVLLFGSGATGLAALKRRRRRK